MKNLKHFLTTKDFLKTGRSFDIVKNLKTGILETHPRPSLDELPQYYESENYISHNQNSSGFLAFCYRRIRSISTKRKINICLNTIESLKSKTKVRVLDVGCGTGHFLVKCREKGWSVKGIENNVNAINSSPKELAQDIVKNFKALKPLTEKFDIITMWHSLEHLHMLESVIIDMKKLLTYNGTILVACPNHRSFDAGFYKENWAAYDLPRHLWHFDKTSIKNLFLNYKLELTKALPMYWDSFYISILSEKIINKNPSYFKGVLVGLISNLRALSSKEYSSLIYVFKNKT
ncbi:class I SAM-dependent methyltransferase [Flavobacteriaceae bacterium]|nr:class I SAM-dependent methyltransferase [Flavobacteriaceae bacterium]MDB9712106.1 class I SAM-dependent methyltransferase [Flavobacteriaceae bacterium]MDC1492213.1 class I SAM-dependent methyltransferase [Flavobacteriaceae bacterium]